MNSNISRILEDLDDFDNDYYGVRYFRDYVSYEEEEALDKLSVVMLDIARKEGFTYADVIDKHVRHLTDGKYYFNLVRIKDKDQGTGIYKPNILVTVPFHIVLKGDNNFDIECPMKHIKDKELIDSANRLAKKLKSSPAVKAAYKNLVKNITQF